MRTRPPAVAGTFYPAERAELARTVDALLEHAAPGARPKAIVVPHAGYVYSGAIAAAAFRRVEGFTRVVLLGPAHSHWLRGLAVPDATSFATPLGAVDIAATSLPQSGRAHAREHSLEVEVPFLQRRLGSFSLIPIVVGDASAPEVADALDEHWGGSETLIVVSTDLSHYLPYPVARQRDRATAMLILALEPVSDEAACGARPLNGFLESARRHSLRGELLDLRNSGDTSGDKASVVGYGAFAFT